MTPTPGTPAAPPPTLIVHGGAWDIPDDLVAGYLAGVRAAAQAGAAVLAAGGRALDAAEAAVRLMEDDPIFDAGRGSFLTRDGTVELDAGLMLGPGQEVGAVAAVRRVAHPITLARHVLESGRFAMLAGPGATRFAQETGLDLVEDAALIVPREQARWDALRRDPQYDPREAFGDATPGDTVGAVARDHAGRIAAATSTGGVPFKTPGRVGDTPLPGCGFYATAAGGASCTGYGEAILRVGLARTAVERLAAPWTLPPRAAAQAALTTLTALDAAGGLILLPAAGPPTWAFTTPRMAVAWLTDDGTIQAEIEA
jgi:beta-aspartyl-peptidase (threonine type)